MELFAWLSDHDTWHRRWLESLVEAIDAEPAAVLAYPHSVGVTNEGRIVSRPRSFQTVGLRDPYRRVTAAWEDGAAGSMVYGLMRADELEACGVYRLVRDPDRLLMTELAMRGTFVQVPEVLYFRRRSAVKPTQERQRRAIHPEGTPLRAFLPWQARHAWQLLVHYVLRRPAGTPVSRTLGLRVTAFYFMAGLERGLHRYVFSNRDRSSFDRLLLRVTARRKRQLSLTQEGPSRQELKPLERTIQGGVRTARRRREAARP
jgi:hypothetical protein